MKKNYLIRKETIKLWNLEITISLYAKAISLPLEKFILYYYQPVGFI